MSFACPQLLWLLLLPLFWLVWEVARRRKVAGNGTHPKILRAEVGAHALALVEGQPASRASRLRPWLLLGMSFTILALARPQWGRVEEPVFDQSREILLAVDLSRSMLSPDVKPTRLDRAKLLIQALLEKLKGERVGLIVFSGTAFLQSPLSGDYEILREFLPALSPKFLPEGGTNYTALIDTSLDAFGESGAADRFLIILSDGEATDDDWQSRVSQLQKKGIRVIGLGIGTSAGTMIPDGSGGFVKDSRGAVVLSKLESDTLRKLASATNGTYRDASAWIDLAGLVQQTVDAGKKGSFVDKSSVRLIDRFQWPLALALWCFLVSFYYEFPVRPRPRAITLHGQPGPSKTPAPTTTRPVAGTVASAMIALLALATALLSPAPLRAAVKIAPPTSTPSAPAPTPPAGSPAESAQSLGRVVGRLSQQPRLSDADLSELAHETLTWGKRLKDAGTPVPPGPVRDAVGAVDQLESHGNKLADWSQLRGELEQLLEKPPEQKQPPQQNQQQDQQKSDSSKDQNKQQQQKQDQQQNSTPQNQQGDPTKSDPKQGQPQPQPEQKADKPDQPQAFGDMTKRQPPPTPSNETQKVGGTQDKTPPKEPIDPALAMPMEKLDQLKNQDSPAQLFQMLQADRSQASQKKPQKDW